MRWLPQTSRSSGANVSYAAVRGTSVHQIHASAMAMAPPKKAQKAVTRDARTLGIAGNKFERQRQRTQITPATVASVSKRSTSEAGPMWLAWRSAPAVREAQAVVRNGMVSNTTSARNGGS